MFGVLIASASLIAKPHQGELTVVVKNIENVEGSLSIVLFDSEGDFLNDGNQLIKKVNKKGEISVTFKNVEEGTYAISVIHDQNESGDLDTGLFGIPTEPYGFSNDAKGSFGPPSYADSKFEFEGDKTIEINLN